MFFPFLQCYDTNKFIFKYSEQVREVTNLIGRKREISTWSHEQQTKLQLIIIHKKEQPQHLTRCTDEEGQYVSVLLLSSLTSGMTGMYL